MYGDRHLFLLPTVYSNMEDYIKERIRIWEWFIRGYGRHGLEFRDFKGITKEWLIGNYNVEEDYFK
jgi:hypothetical protein